MAIPLRVLSVGSVWVGWRTKDRMIGLGSPFWGQALYTHVDGRLRIDAELISSHVKLIPVMFSMGGGGRARWRYGSYGNAKKVYERKVTRLKSRYVYLSKKWFFDKVYTEWVVVPVRHHAYHTTYKGIDRGVIEMRGPAGLSQALYQRAKRLGKIQSGEVYHYSLIMVIGRVRLLMRTMSFATTTRGGYEDRSLEKRFRVCMRYFVFNRS
jgi:NADH:ubiquinone oxidoreductase subunit 5 (subunit L)/multisubunit Na+/H+ antiporter MnhA subunit